MNKNHIFIYACLISTASLCSADSDVHNNLGEEYAKFTYKKGYKNSGLANASNQFYSHAYDNTCASVSGSAKFFALTGKQKTIPVKANIKTIIYASTNNIRYSGPAYPGVELTQKMCVNKISFTPKPNNEYFIIQNRENDGPCQLNIIDSSGAQPLDYEVLEYRACIK